MLGLNIDVKELKISTKTAQQAADAMSVDVDQIAKSIIFQGETTGNAILFVTAGSNRVDVNTASIIAGENLRRADAAFIREETGFAIGGVSPLGHIKPSRTFFDPRLQDFKTIWAAAGTPNHMFEIAPELLAEVISASIVNFTE